MFLIGAGLILAGVAVHAAMWFSKMGGDVVSNRDPGYSRDRIERFDPQPHRAI